MKLGFIGLGVVGHATMEAFAGDNSCFGYDKFKDGYHDFAPILDTEICFISVPTLSKPDGEQDLSPLEEVLALLSDGRYYGTAVVKCTVAPKTMDRMAERFPSLRLVHNPEFLTAKTPYTDYVNAQTHLLSGHVAATKPVAELLHSRFPNALIDVVGDFKITEMVKYMHNCFLSVKVSFCNEIAEMSHWLGIAYDDVRNRAEMMNGIGHGHTQVPGPDGKVGFGGMCFPKDTAAWLYFAQTMNVKQRVVEAAVEGNKLRRIEE